MNLPLLNPAAVAIVAIAAATVALCLGHIDQATFVAIVGSFGGVGIGAGAHAAGVNAGASSSSSSTTSI